VSLVVGPAEFAPIRGAGQQGRPTRRPADDSPGNNARPAPGSDDGVMASDQCTRAWEGAYRHYGRIWELTARSPKGDPVAAQEMASASWAVAAAWRQIATATTLPWWAIAAIESAAAAFEEQARRYETGDESESHSHERDR
jgi:hypothetical protein